MTPEPYAGPRPFTIDDRARFFGRKQEVDETVSFIMAHPVVLIYARSGVGKSSLVHAGVVPSLREEGYAVLPPARVEGVIPEGIAPASIANPSIFQALCCWLDEQDVPFCAPEEVTELRLADFVAEWMKVRAPLLEDASPVLIFEEIISGYESRGKERHDFFLQLADAIAQHPSLKIVLTIREEFVALLEPFAKYFPRQLRVRKRIERLTAPAALAAITGPVAEFGVNYGEGVAEKLVNDLLGLAGDDETLGEFVEPVQLQVVCRNLWAKLPEEFKTPSPPGAAPQVITLAHLEAAGEVTAALSNYYNDAIHASVAASGMAEGVLRRWFGETLISADHLGLGMAVKGQSETAAIPESVIHVLMEKYLIRHEKRGATEWYELAQARFIQPILSSNEAWLSQRSGAEAIRRELERRAATLIRTGDSLKEWEIGQAENFLKSPEARVLGDHEAIRALVQRSREQLEERRQARERELKQEAVAALQEQRLKEQARSIRLRNRLLIGLALMATAACVMAITAYYQRGRAEAESKIAKARELAFRAVDVNSTDGELAVLLALHSYSVQPTSEGVSALHQALVASPLRLRLAGQDGHKDRTTGKPCSVLTSAYSRDGQQILTGGLDNTVRIWNAETGTFEGKLGEDDQQPTGWVWSIAFSPDGKQIASGSKDGTVRIWPYPRPANGPWPAPKILPPHLGGQNDPIYVLRVAFDATGSRLLTCYEDGSACVWDVASGGEIVRLLGHTGSLRGGAFSPTQNLVVTAGKDNTAKLWDLTPYSAALPSGTAAPTTDQPRFILQPPKKEEQGLWDARFSPDGQKVITAGGDHVARLWDVRTGLSIAEIDGHTGPMMAAKFIDDETIVTVSIDKTARLWHLREVIEPMFPVGDSFGNPIPLAPVPMRRLTATPVAVFRGHNGYLRSVDISPDHRRLVTTDREGTALVWQMPPAFEAAILRTPTHIVRDVAFSPDGKRLVTGASDTPVVWSIWGDSMEKEVLSLKGHTRNVQGVAWRPDGKRIATAAADGSAKEWDAETGKELHSFSGHSEAIRTVAYDPSGRFLVTASDDRKAVIWETDAGKSVELIGSTARVYAAAFSPDGSKVLTVGEDQAARIWDRASGKELEKFEIGGDILLDGAFSPTGQEILVACANGRAYILDTNHGGRQVCELSGHEGQVRRARYFEFTDLSGAKRTGILTAGYDGTVRIWEAGTLPHQWEQTTLLTGSNGPAYAIAVSADGCQIATGSADRSARIYYRDGDWLLKLARTRVTRPLTTEEKLYYGIKE